MVEMAARRGRIPLRWRAVQEIDRSQAPPVIAYRHIWGPTRGMDVAWRFQETPDGVHVSITHRFHPPWPVVGNMVTDHIIGPRFIEHVAGLTLSAIKKFVERELELELEATSGKSAS